MLNECRAKWFWGVMLAKAGSRSRLRVVEMRVVQHMWPRGHARKRHPRRTRLMMSSVLPAGLPGSCPYGGQLLFPFL